MTKQEKVLLSPEELLEAIRACYESVDLPRGGSVEMKVLHAGSIALAQAKKFIEWDEGTCPHVSHSRARHWCGDCWEALLEEVKAF